LRGDRATRAICVGVNKHRDPAIPELSGARWDATALRAPFTDTIGAFQHSSSSMSGRSYNL
jgi:hypothetical protein